MTRLLEDFEPGCKVWFIEEIPLNKFKIRSGTVRVSFEDGSGVFVVAGTSKQFHGGWGTPGIDFFKSREEARLLKALRQI